MAAPRDPESKAGLVRAFFEKHGLETTTGTVIKALEAHDIRPSDVGNVKRVMLKEVRENGTLQAAAVTLPTAAAPDGLSQRVCLEQTLVEDLRAVKMVAKKVGGYNRLRQLIGILE